MTRLLATHRSPERAARVVIGDCWQSVQGDVETLISVRVTTNSESPGVEKTGAESYSVRVDEKAVGGRANSRLIEIMAKHLGVRKSQISIVKGAKTRNKLLLVISES